MARRFNVDLTTLSNCWEAWSTNLWLSNLRYCLTICVEVVRKITKACTIKHTLTGDSQINFMSVISKRACFVGYGETRQWKRDAVLTTALETTKQVCRKCIFSCKTATVRREWSGLVCRKNTVLKEVNVIIGWALQKYLLTTNYWQTKLTNLLINQLIKETTKKIYGHCFSTLL
jgi:hypothetical protein